MLLLFKKRLAEKRVEKIKLEDWLKSYSATNKLTRIYDQMKHEVCEAKIYEGSKISKFFLVKVVS